MAVVMRSGKVLVQRRFRKNVGMIHEFPGGRIDQGESPQQAAKRELLEETGMKSGLEIIGSDKLTNDWEGEIHFVVMTAFATEEPQATDSRRQQSFRWLDVSEIPVTDFCKADRQFIDQRLQHYIRLSNAATRIDHKTLRAVPCDANKLIEEAQRLVIEAKETNDVDSLILKLSKSALSFAIAGCCTEALDLVNQVTSNIERTKLRTKTVAQIRTAQVLQFANKHKDAKAQLKELVLRCRKNDELTDLLDYSLQHLGKVYFDLNQILKAQNCFNEAMKLRQCKKDKSLINSTKIAINACKKRLNYNESV